MQFFYTHVSDEAKRLVNQVMNSGFLNEGPMVKKFEDALSERGLENPLTVNSCTSALQLALECCDVKDKWVILQPQTFISTGLSIIKAGGFPVFADIDEDMSGNICIESVRRLISMLGSESIGAVVTTHWGGSIGRLSELWSICLNNGIYLIEDAAHAFGSQYINSPIGSCYFSDFCCFSFQSIKVLTCGDGGCICTRHKNFADKIKRLKWFGIDRSTMERNFDGTRDMWVEECGGKYHMNDLAAAMGLGNLSDIDERLAVRKSIANMYDNYLNKEYITRAISEYSSNWLYTITVKDKDYFIRHMQSNNIPVSSVDLGIDTNPIFHSYAVKNDILKQKLTKKQLYLKNQRLFDRHQISLPINESMTINDVEKVIHTVNKFGD